MEHFIKYIDEIVPFMCIDKETHAYCVLAGLETYS